MREALANNPLVVATESESIELVRKGSHILLMQEDDIISFRTQQMCDLAHIRSGLPYMRTHFVFAKNSSSVPAFNKAILMHGDFVRHAYRKYLSSKRRNCELEEHEGRHYHPLSRSGS